MADFPEWGIDAFGFANNKSADQPELLCSLISTFVIHLWKVSSKLATSKIYSLSLYEAEQAGLDITPEDRFSCDKAQMIPCHFLLLIRKHSREFYFRETSHMRSFVKIKPSRNGEITVIY